MNNQNNTILLQYTVVLSQLVSSTYSMILCWLGFSIYKCHPTYAEAFVEELSPKVQALHTVNKTSSQQK